MYIKNGKLNKDLYLEEDGQREFVLSLGQIKLIIQVSKRNEQRK